MKQFQSTALIGFGVIFGAWATAAAPHMNSTPTVTAIVLTVGAVGMTIHDFKKARR